MYLDLYVYLHSVYSIADMELKEQSDEMFLSLNYWSCKADHAIPETKLHFEPDLIRRIVAAPKSIISIRCTF